MENINKAVILSSGEGGVKIQEALSKAGLKVVVLDSKKDYGKELGDADLVVEALSGGAESTKEVLCACDEKAQAKAILATTTSSGITEVAAATKRPQNVIGMNFVFNPFDEKCVVQITKGFETSEEAVQACKNLVEQAGAMAIVLRDSPGLVLDRVIASVINEAVIVVATGTASVEDVDNITKLCLNWPLGPFEFADTIGIDNVVATLEVLSQQFGQRFLPCPLLKQMVAAGQLGKKTGKGFYTY